MKPLLSHAVRRASVAAAALVAVLALSAELPAQQQSQQASGRTRVLVPPLQTADGVNDDFGNNVAERVRERLQDFDILTAVTGDEIDDALDEFDLDRDQMTPVQWRQLAGQINAGLIIFGEATPASGGGVDVQMRFVDAKTGDELRQPSFSVSGDGGDGRQAAADQIASSLDTQVTFMRSLLFCEDYFGAEQFEDALRNCNKALSINETSSRAHMIRGQIYREREQWEDARADFAAVVENNESNTDALQNLAYVNAQLGNTDRATELYREYLNFNPDDAQVRLNVAYNLASAGALDQSIGLLQDGIERDSTNANLWKYMGDVALRKGTASSGTEVQAKGGGEVQDSAAVRLAVDAYEHVLEIRGDSAQPSLIQNTIKAQMQMGNLQEALDFADDALSERPEDTTTLGLKASILARQENYEQAAAVMDSVISLDPDFNQAYLRRGNYRLQAGASVDDVMPDFEQAVENGTSGDVIANRMLAVGYNDYFQNDELQTAAQLFQTGLEFAESGSDISHQLHFFLGFGAYQQGSQIDSENSEEACEPAEQALEYFQQAQSHLKQAGDYQASSQKKLLKATGDYIYRQNQIIKKAC